MLKGSDQITKELIEKAGKEVEKNGNVLSLLLLDNCTAHNVDQSKCPSLLITWFLPSNVTNRHQPAGMKMIV